jgi:hypothetical protein
LADLIFFSFFVWGKKKKQIQRGQTNSVELSPRGFRGSLGEKKKKIKTKKPQKNKKKKKKKKTFQDQPRTRPMAAPGAHLSMEYLEPLEHDPAQEAVEGFRESLKTAEEIAQFSVDESLGELERAVMFVDGGVAVQRLSVVNNLVYLVKQFGRDALARLVPAVCAMLPSQEREIQHSAAGAFRTLIETRLLGADAVAAQLLAPALEVLACDDEAIAASWLDTLEVMTPLLPRERLAGDVTRFAMEMGSVTQGIVSRLLACRLLGSLAAHLSAAEIERTFFNQAMALCQDTDFDVRICMCEQLPAIAKGVGPELARKVLLPELVELLRDEEATVRAQAVRTTVEMIPALEDAAKREQLLPLVRKFARSEPEPDMVEVVAESFGPMIHALSPVLSEAEADEFYELYKGLAERPASTLRRWCAFNFPAVLKAMGIAKYAIHLHGLYLKLACDPDPEVRKCIAAGFHEVCRMMGADRCAKYLREPLVSLLRDDAEVALELLPNLRTTLSLYKTGDAGAPLVAVRGSPFSEILPAMLQLEHAVRPRWRRHVALLAQWADLPAYLTGEQILDHVVPLLLSALAEAPYPVKAQATQLLCSYIRSNRAAAQRAELVSAVIADFAEVRGGLPAHFFFFFFFSPCFPQSTDYHQRLIFLSICSAVLDCFSRRFFRDFLFDEVMELADDAVPNVRRRVATLLPQLKKVLRGTWAQCLFLSFFLSFFLFALFFVMQPNQKSSIVINNMNGDSQHISTKTGLLGPIFVFFKKHPNFRLPTVEDAKQYEVLKDKTATLMTDTDAEVRRLALGSAKELSRIQAIRCVWFDAWFPARGCALTFFFFSFFFSFFSFFFFFLFQPIRFGPPGLVYGSGGGHPGRAARGRGRRPGRGRGRRRRGRAQEARGQCLFFFQMHFDPPFFLYGSKTKLHTPAVGLCCIPRRPRCVRGASTRPS